MAFNKITDQDTAGLGVTGLADVPGLSTEDMQKQFDEFPQYLVTRLNQLIDELMAEAAAEFIGSKDGNIQGAIDSIKEQLMQKAGIDTVLTKDNDEAYTPTEQYNPATKGYVDDKLVEFGAGDMTKAVYDPQGRENDIFAAVDEAKGYGEAGLRAATEAKGVADEAISALGGCWIEFTDEDGNPTEEPYIHWMQEV